MRKMLTIFLSVFIVSAAVADGYEAGVDFRIDNELSFHGDPNFSDFSVLGAQSVMAGMDFDADGKAEILFTMDETLPPGGPDPGNVGVFLYEADGAGGYTYVWSFVSPDLGNSLPGLAHGDIDGDGKHEIYFGVPPAAGSNDATWGTYIFEQGADMTFPTTATLLHQYGFTAADNFRPAGYALGDIDGDGKVELVTTDRYNQRMSIDALTGSDLDALASLTREYLDTDNLAGGGVYDVDIADTDRDGKHEIWVNTWDNFSMTIFEATGADTYVLAADLNGLFPPTDPGSFNRTGFAFNDVNRDGDHDAWFPMTNGKLYYFDNPALDSIAPNTFGQGGVDGGTSDWTLSASGVSVAETGDTLYYQTMIDTLLASDGVTDSLVYDTSLVALAPTEGDSALQISGGSALISVASPAVGSQFYAHVDVMAGHPGYTVADGGHAIFSVNFKNSAGSIVPTMHSADTLAVASTAGTANSWRTWNSLELFLTVPAGAATVEIGVKHEHATTTATTVADGAIFVDAMEMKPVVGNGVADIDSSHFSEVLTFGPGSCRGGGMGNIDGDSKPDIIVGTGTGETVVWMEYVGSDPKDAMSYTTTTILSSKGAPLDRFYPLSISGTDLDGDGRHEVVISNLFATQTSQAQLIVLEHAPYQWSNDGGNEALNAGTGWSVLGYGTAAMVDVATDSLEVSKYNNTRALKGGMDMDQDGKHEVVTTSYAGRVFVYEYDGANNAFDVVWTSPTPDSLVYTLGTRSVNVGDLDGDGKHEIVFPVSAHGALGYHIYEWDGVVGSDNYGTQISSINTLYLGVENNNKNMRHERFEIEDVDGDGQQELISVVRDGSKGTIISSLGAGDDMVHNSGGGLETWSIEFQTSHNDFGGGSPYHALPVDYNGDGKKEIANTHWQQNNSYNIAVTGPDAYTTAEVGSEGSYYYATALDQHSLGGMSKADVDGDGNEEAYFVSYGKNMGFVLGIVGAGELFVVDYDADDDVTKIGPDQVKKVADFGGNIIGGIGNAYNGNTNPNIFTTSTSSKVPQVQAHEYIGPDPKMASSYLQKAIYYGELDVAERTITTTAEGTVDTTFRRRWGFPIKAQANWGDDLLDFDGDGKNEILMAFQSNPDSLTHKTVTWDATGDSNIVVETTVVNPKNWEWVLLENGTEALSTDDQITFISPEEYRLEQNYPNPFNPNTTIQYTVPINRKVSIKIYNVNGQLVNTLVNNKLVSAGTHKVMWNGKNANGLQVSTGMYFYSLEWAGMKKVKSMTLLK